MKTQLGKDYRNTLSFRALNEIQDWAARAAKGCHSHGDSCDDANVAAAFHADAAQFARLDKAIRDVLEGSN